MAEDADLTCLKIKRELSMAEVVAALAEEVALVTEADSAEEAVVDSATEADSVDEAVSATEAVSVDEAVSVEAIVVALEEAVEASTVMLSTKIKEI